MPQLMYTYCIVVFQTEGYKVVEVDVPVDESVDEPSAVEVECSGVPEIEKREVCQCVRDIVGLRGSGSKAGETKEEEWSGEKRTGEESTTDR